MDQFKYKDNSCRISVIIPVYNSEKYLEACLNSVLSQDEKKLEIWVIDDASTDRSLEMLRLLQEKDARIHIVQFKEHRGVNAARNAALDLVTGEYLVFCDSDDTVPPNAYSSLANAASNGQYDVVIGGHIDYYDGGYCVKRPIKINKDKIDAFMQTSTVWERIWRRDFVTRNNLRFPNYLTGGDAVFVSYAYRCKPVTGFVDKYIYCYWNRSQLESSIIHTYKYIYFKDRLRCCEELVQVLSEIDEKSAKEYVYIRQLAYLKDKFMHILDGEEAEAAFKAFKVFLKKFDWGKYPEVFENEFGMTMECLLSLSALQYHLKCKERVEGILEPRDQVLIEYQKGKIGFYYIKQYFLAWLKCKLQH